MSLLQCLAITLVLATSSTALADASDHATAPLEPGDDARIVPVFADGAFYGLKVYVVRPGGRFDQPTAQFKFGDTVEAIDGHFVSHPDFTKLLVDRVIEGKADATVHVRRDGKLVRLRSQKVAK